MDEPRQEPLEVPAGDLPPQTQGPGLDKPIGRRAFLGLALVGVAALFVGKELYDRLFVRGKRAVGTEGFRINSLTPVPDFDEGTWRLAVDGLVQNPLSLSLTQFRDLPQVDVVRDFQCVEGWGVQGVTWTGVTLKAIMDLSGARPQVTHLVFHSADGIYTDSLTMEEALRSDALLVHRLNGEPLTGDMGRPVRLILPGSFGYKYVKWVVRVEAVALGPEGYMGYWERNGYPADATI